MEAFADRYFNFIRSIGPTSILRMAPTPSGYLHAGNALNFILNWLAAKTATKDAAKILLRIDDLDTDRSRPEFLEDIDETLRWLGLDYEGAAWRQSDHLPGYRAVLTQLRITGLLFACRKSRKDLEPFGGKYPTAFRQQGFDLDEPDVAWRIKTPAGFPLPDFVVRRRDGIPAYQVASFSDDLELGVSHLIRGADLEDSSAAQVYLAQVLGATQFLKIQYLHHPLLLDREGEKLSKSAGSLSLKHLRESGAGPEPVFQQAAAWLGLNGNSASSLLDDLKSRL